eukprot:542539_1
MASKSDNEMFKDVASLCGFNTDPNTLNLIRNLIESTGDLQSKNKKQEPKQIQHTDWGYSTTPPHGTPGKIKAYWNKSKNPGPIVINHRRYMAMLLLEIKWGKKDCHKTFFIQRTRKYKQAKCLYIKSRIQFHKSNVISAAHQLDIETVKEYLIEQKAKKNNNNDRKIKLIASNYIEAVNSANKMLMVLDEALSILEDEIVNKLEIAKRNNFVPSGYVNKLYGILGGGKKKRAPNTFEHYIELVQNIKSLKNVMEVCKTEIMNVNYSLIGLNKKSLTERSMKYKESKLKRNKHQANKRQKIKKSKKIILLDVCWGFDLPRFMFIRITDSRDGYYGFQFASSFLNVEDMKQLRKVNKMCEAVMDIALQRENSVAIQHGFYFNHLTKRERNKAAEKVVDSNGKFIFCCWKPLTIQQFGLSGFYNKIIPRRVGLLL